MTALPSQGMDLGLCCFAAAPHSLNGVGPPCVSLLLVHNTDAWVWDLEKLKAGSGPQGMCHAAHPGCRVARCIVLLGEVAADGQSHSRSGGDCCASIFRWWLLTY